MTLKSSRQIHHDKRAARKVAELGLGDFAPLDEAIPELNGGGGRLGGSDPMSAGPEAGSSSPSDVVPLAGALHHRAPAAVVDHAGRPAAGDPVAAGVPLGPRWATPASDPAANQTEQVEIIDIRPPPPRRRRNPGGTVPRGRTAAIRRFPGDLGRA